MPSSGMLRSVPLVRALTRATLRNIPEDDILHQKSNVCRQTKIIIKAKNMGQIW
jgi:hypothetical protein